MSLFLRTAFAAATGALLFLCSASAQLESQLVYPPKREVRAVWVTTVLGLDWPHSTDPERQRRDLLEIVRKLSANRYNTIFFQVRGRGDAMYRSLYEPWSASLTGTLGKDPG